MKGAQRLLGGMLIVGAVAGVGNAWAECGGDHATVAQDGAPTEAREIVVVVPSGATSTEVVNVVATGGTGQSVRVIVPSNGSATAIGGDGAAGVPGGAGR